MRDDGAADGVAGGRHAIYTPPVPAAAIADPARLDALGRTGLVAAAHDPVARAAFDRLSRLATRLLGVPTAVVSLVAEDRQVFVGCVGLGGPAGAARETPLSHSLCQHVVTSGAPVLLEDARTDPRAAAGVPGHGAVRDLGVVAYAGVPLLTTDGQVLGAFAVLDGAPRRWSADDLAALTDLAAAVAAEIELRGATAEARCARGTAEAAQAAAEDARGVADRARKRTALLQGLTSALAGARTLDAVAAVVVERMTGALGARTGALAVPTPDGAALAHVRTAGFPPALAARLARQPLDPSQPVTPAAVAYRTRRPVWIERREGADGLDAGYPDLAGVFDTLGAGSAVIVPLLLGDDEPVGTISFAFPGPRAFSEAERNFYLALARQCALAIDRARLSAAERAARSDAEAARATAELANRSKADFLATMSHELRTPLNAIGGYAELLQLGIRGPVTAAQVEDLERITRAQQHLLGLINGVLNYAKIDAGAVHYAITDVPLAEVLHACEALLSPQVRAKGLRCAYEALDPAVRVRGDREKVQQVVLNLLSNAVKFTKPGGRVTLAGRAAGPLVVITVEDTGVGIPADELARVFEPFVQVDSAYTRAQEGTGLGLAISRDLARGMGGDLTAESTPGVGSTFTLTLPAAPVAA